MNKTIVIILVIVAISLAVGIYFLLPKSNPEILTANLNQTMQQQNQQTATNFDIQGMKVEILKQGTGEAVKSGDKVTVNYTGTLTDGTKFDSSLNPGRTPFSFEVGNSGPGGVIQGWNLGVEGMKVGEERKLTIPPELGYGAQAVGGVIPANSTLIFVIDLLGINQ